MKHPRRILLIVAWLIITVAVITATALVAARVLQKGPTAVNCTTHGTTHEVAFMDGKVIQPDHIDAKLCDRLTIRNQTSKEVKVGFGWHLHHVAYDGVAEKELAKGQSFTFSLNKPGTYNFHDHHDPGVKASFTVTP